MSINRSNIINKVKPNGPQGSEYEIVPTKITDSSSSYSASLPTLTADSTISLDHSVTLNLSDFTLGSSNAWTRTFTAAELTILENKDSYVVIQGIGGGLETCVLIRTGTTERSNGYRFVSTNKISQTQNNSGHNLTTFFSWCLSIGLQGLGTLSGFWVEEDYLKPTASTNNYYYSSGGDYHHFNYINIGNLYPNGVPENEVVHYILSIDGGESWLITASQNNGTLIAPKFLLLNHSALTNNILEKVYVSNENYNTELYIQLKENTDVSVTITQISGYRFVGAIALTRTNTLPSGSTELTVEYLGKIQDVRVGTTSNNATTIVNDNVAILNTETAYNASTNKIATMADITNEINAMKENYISIDFETTDLTSVTEGNDIYFGTYALSENEYNAILNKKDIKGRIGNNRTFSWPMLFKLEEYDEYIDSESIDGNNMFTNWVKHFVYTASGGSRNIYGIVNINYDAKIEFFLYYSGSWSSTSIESQQAPDFSYGDGKSITPTISYNYKVDYLATSQFAEDLNDSSTTYYFDQLLLQAFATGRSEAKIVNILFDGFITELNLIVRNSSAFSSIYPYCQLKFRPTTLGVNNAFPVYYSTFVLEDGMIDNSYTTTSTYDIYIQSWGYSDGEITYQKMIILKRLDSKEINDTYAKKMVTSNGGNYRTFINNTGTDATIQTTVVTNANNNDALNYSVSTNISGLSLTASTIEGGSITNQNQVILSNNDFTWNGKTITTTDDAPKIRRFI